MAEHRHRSWRYRIRWRVTRWLQRRPGWCNASLICWAEWGGFPGERTLLRNCRVNWVCIQDATVGGYGCYCGALDGTGCDTRATHSGEAHHG